MASLRMADIVSQKFYEAGGSDFTNFFLAFPNGFPEGVKTDEQKKDAFKSREGILELCWNHGTGKSSLISRQKLLSVLA